MDAPILGPENPSAFSLSARAVTLKEYTNFNGIQTRF
jgi:hypothetical protein